MGPNGINQALLQSLLRTLVSTEPGRGLPSVIQRFRDAGAGDAVSSWIGTDRNETISPEQVHQGLGTHRLRNLAQCAGLTEGAAATALAALLPSVVDQLTPDGVIPEPDQLPQLATRIWGDQRRSII
jgi:uncharacterized protein YidB (DUF937 family)